MKISVLMSVYKNDNPEFLKLALESIYDNQTRKPEEIVVVFDGKLTDELYLVLDNFRKGKENLVFYYPQEVNRGLGEALRIGSLKCSGDYIFRMDSDDISYPQRFEIQEKYLDCHPEIDVLGTEITEFINSNDEENMRIRICRQKHNEIVKMAKHRNPMNHMTVAIRTEALKDCGGYKTNLLLEDYYLWVRMMSDGYIFENINEPLVYVRIGNGFIKRRGSKTQIKGWKNIQKHMLKHKMVNPLEACINMIYIIGFTYCPSKLRYFVYKKFLRK